MNTGLSIERRGSKLFLILFVLVLCTDLFCIWFQKDSWRFISKPLLMLCLGGYLIADSQIKHRLTTWVIFALLFSWIGDVLLMFENRDSIFFLLGLSAFLIAHVFYIVYFHQLKIIQGIKSHGWLLIIVALYYATLITLLYPTLGDMKIPVPIYGLVISFMLLSAMHMPFGKNKVAGQLMMIGAVLFILSDSVLAINKFYKPFEAAGLVIMLTYGLAQLLIVEGARRVNSKLQS